MDIRVTRYRPQDENQSVHEAAASQPRKPIRIRIQPQIYFATKTPYRTGAFYAWRNVYWNIACATVEDAIALKDVLQRIFMALHRDGREPFERLLDSLDAVAVQSAPSASETAR